MLTIWPGNNLAGCRQGNRVTDLDGSAPGAAHPQRILAIGYVYQHDAIVAVVRPMGYLTNCLTWLVTRVGQRLKGDLFWADERDSAPFE
jgi:hypothetical protein